MPVCLLLAGLAADCWLPACPAWPSLPGHGCLPAYLPAYLPVCLPVQEEADDKPLSLSLRSLADPHQRQGGSRQGLGSRLKGTLL